MTEENKEEVKQPQEVAKVTEVVNKDTITIDLDGVSIDVPVETGKKLIEARQKNKRDFKELSEKVAKAEAAAKSEAEKLALTKAMKENDIESVKAQISSEYIAKIAQYEERIFKGEVKAHLAALGVLAEAIDDGATLALQGTKVTLDGQVVKINDKDSKEYLSEWIKGKSHLVAVKSPEGKGKLLVKGGKPFQEKTNAETNLKSGLGKLFK